MRPGKSSSKAKNGGQEIDYPENLKEPQLSGAYIRSLVKQLTPSRAKDSISPKQHQSSEGISSASDGFSQQDKQHKKQVRRRLHAARPYQEERLLNMAQARREIAAALKFHRAAMKQAAEKPKHHLEMESGMPGFQFQENSLKSRRSPRIDTPNSAIPDSFSNSPGLCSSVYSWPSVSSNPSTKIVLETSNFGLPAQTLGLNLNLEEFANLDGANPSFFKSSPTSATAGGIPPPGNPGLHPAMDDKEMAEIRSIGEQYQMEWNDIVNLANSAWWLEFLKAMEVGAPENGNSGEVMELPGGCWLTANGGSCLQSVSDDYFQDPAFQW